MIDKEEVPDDWHMTLTQESGLTQVPKHLIRVAKVLARDLGETCPDAFYYYIGSALIFCADNIDEPVCTPEWEAALDKLLEDMDA